MSVFRSVGPYEISRQIGRGMNPVFLATDTRSGDAVALKVVSIGPNEDDREILDAEEQGAELQRRFSALTEYVPRVYEVGRASDYFFIAMEYVEGEDLSTILNRGPIAADRAVAIAIQLCRFLEQVDRIAGAEGESALTLLHNDLKPGNIRLQPGDRVKILDFGAAKVLSLSKRVTRNVFGSIPYLSPECLETGKRDRHTDAWALGVLMYEMVAGRAPFHASDTVSLERRIRSRQPADPPTGVPDALQRIIARLLAPYPADRYQSASAIRTDLENVTAGVETADTTAPWPQRTVDEPVTRRTRQPFDDQPPTRVIAAPVAAMEPQAGEGKAVSPLPMSRSLRRMRRLLLAALAVLVIFVVTNTVLVARQANRLAASVPLQEFAGLTSAWSEYQGLVGRSVLGVGLGGLEGALHRHSRVLADRVIANYRSPAPTVREAQWQAAALALRRALTLEPGDNQMRASLRYVEGHLHRIDGDADKSRSQSEAARREFAEAVTAFREAAELRSDWPDPFLGLARTFIYGIEDIDRGADAIAEARRLGYAIGPRETAQLGDGYRARGETLERTADSLDDLPQARESLTRAVEAYEKALEHYSTIADHADVATRIRLTQARLAAVQKKLARPASLSGPLDRFLEALGAR